MCGVVGIVVSKLGLLGLEVFEAGVQARDALFAALGGELALLEGLEVALGCAFCACDLGGDCVASLIERRLFDPGYTTINVTTTSVEKCISLEESVALLPHELAEGSGAKTLKDTATISEGSRTLASTSWEVDHPGEAEQVDKQNSEEVVQVAWSCDTPGVTGSFVVTSHGLIGPTITSSGQFGSVSAAWCSSTRKREKARAKREAAKRRKERPEREAEERKEKAEERREEASPLGQAKKAFVKAANTEGRYPLNEVSMFGTKCRRTGGTTFVCSWLWVRGRPYQNEEITATVTREHAHYYVSPFSFNE